MERMGVVGATVRRQGQAEVSRLSIPAGEAGDLQLRRLHAAGSFEESAVIATCNRVEVVFVGADGVDCAEARRRLWRAWRGAGGGGPAGAPGEALTPPPAPPVCTSDPARALFAYAGLGAVERLFVVASAIDSLQPGDAQILGQVKSAWARARRLGLAGPRLAPVFEEALAVAKRVRHQTALGRGRVSMISLARTPIDARLGAVAALGRRPRLVVVGAGDMAQAAGSLFAGRADLDRLFVNRTLAGAEALARRVGGRAAPLAAFLAAPPAADVVVTATAAPLPLIDRQVVARLPAPPPLCVDLSVHHDVDPAAARDHGVDVWDVDRLAHLAGDNLRARQGEVAHARQVVDQALEGFRARQLSRQVAPDLKALREALASSLAHDVARLPAPPIDADGRLDAEAWAARVDAWGRRAAQRLAHGPTVGLRALAAAHGKEAAADFVAATCRAPAPGGPQGEDPCW